jgi:iron(III) transport system ATP-binding protein
MTTPLLLCKNLTKIFKQEKVLHDVNLSVNEGQCLSLIGPSGCGKTTLLRCIAGLEEVSDGEILLTGKNISNDKAENRPIVMMFQQPLLFPHLTVIENVTYGLRGSKIKKKRLHEMGRTMLEKIEMESFGDRYPYELSGGQKQRVALARALILKPRLLLLDEPFSSLDPTLRNSIRSWVKRLLREEGTTAIFVTHDKEEAMMMGDRLAIMKDGTIQQTDSPLHVYQKPINKEVADFFCDGLMLNEHSFLPTECLTISPIDQKKRQTQPTESLLEFKGQVQAHWIKHGLHFYQMWLSDIKKEVTLHSQEIFQVNEEVNVSTLKEKIIDI